MQRLFITTAILACISLGAHAQDTLRLRNTIWVSPAEAFYKQQIGYERLLNNTYSLGIQGAHYSGFRGWYKGWNLTVLGRRYMSRRAPFGLYYQAQAAVFKHNQRLTVYPTSKNQTDFAAIDYHWRGIGGGVGAGVGYRAPILKQAFGGHLSVDGMIGLRYYSWPKPRYDKTQYESRSFLSDDLEWALASPGSAVHGLLAVGYSF